MLGRLQVERFRKVEQCFADFKTGVSSAYVLLEAMPIEAMTQLQVCLMP